MCLAKIEVRAPLAPVSQTCENSFRLTADAVRIELLHFDRVPRFEFSRNFSAVAVSSRGQDVRFST